MSTSENHSVFQFENMTKSFRYYYDKSFTIKDYFLTRNRSKHDKHIVLKALNLSIIEGESVALIGTNGSGKSTILKLMSGIIYPDSGKITTNGKIASLLELGAGFHPDFTGYENIYFNASIFGLNRKEIDNKVQHIIDFSELEEFINAPIRTYSSGMYMRLAFSIAINVEADVILIDEILAVGDQHFQNKCFTKLKELKDAGKTIVIVSHDLNSIKVLCDRTVWIKEGIVNMDGSTSDVVSAYQKECV